MTYDKRIAPKSIRLSANAYAPFSTMMDSFFSGVPGVKQWDQPSFMVDIREDDEAFFVDAALPGVDKKDVSVEFNDGRLVISVKREEETEDKDVGYIHREIKKSAMTRSMLFDRVDGEAIEATLKDGMLTLKVPKIKEEEKKRTIEIR